MKTSFFLSEVLDYAGLAQRLGYSTADEARRLIKVPNCMVELSCPKAKVEQCTLSMEGKTIKAAK